LLDLTACPRCDKAPLTEADGALHCSACRVDFPCLDGIPWLFAEPLAALGEWRGRLQFALQQLGQEAALTGAELEAKNLRPLTRRRLERYRKALGTHRRKLADLLQPLDVQSLSGSAETYLALRTRLPADQGINTYYANVHRDWAWGDDENAAALRQLLAVLHDNSGLGDVLVLGAGACRLAYDLHMRLDCRRTVALDFNPLLLFVAKAVTSGDKLRLHEFPLAPRSLEDDAVLRTLAAPEPVREGFHVVLGDALRAPFAAATFDTVVTPWLIDVVGEEFTTLCQRVNQLLKPDGRWVNFGSLAFPGPGRATRYSPEECKSIIAENGFSDPCVAEATIPYMCSPASRHGRQETVFTFCACKERSADRPPRHRALPDWIVTGNEPVPLTQAFRAQAMTTQIYAFVMSLIDGKRTLKEMAVVLEKQKLMSREEAEPAIRSFLTRMYDDAQKPSGF
jgi:uncharacterized protein YbaR (Trm112 family)